jgi:hypothetical protein
MAEAQPTAQQGKNIPFFKLKHAKLYDIKDIK